LHLIVEVKKIVTYQFEVKPFYYFYNIMKKILFIALSITLFFNQAIYAETAVLYVDNIESISQQNITIIQDLSPLPWIVIKLPQTRKLPKSWQLYQDVTGYFANDTIFTANNVTFPNTKHWHLDKIGAIDFWQKTQGEGMTIALIDSGVDFNHPALQTNLLPELGYDFGDDDAQAIDQLGHGTAMAGLMVANCDNVGDVCGVAPKAKLIPYKINSQNQGQFTSSKLASAILAAADSQADIISLSLTLSEEAVWVKDAINYALSKGKIVVAAAGNEGNSKVAFPANLSNVIAVGAINQHGGLLQNSNYGHALSLTTFGENLWSTTWNEVFGSDYSDFYTGTSPATALVTASLALLKANTQKQSLDLITYLLNLSKDVDLFGFDEKYGFGQLNLITQESSSNLYLSDTKYVYHVGETIDLTLYFSNLVGDQGNLFLMLNFPQHTQRYSLFKIWNQPDSTTATPYNKFIQSPFFFTEDMSLPILGHSQAVLGEGHINQNFTSGFYEVFAQLDLTQKVIAKARRIIYLNVE